MPTNKAGTARAQRRATARRRPAASPPQPAVQQKQAYAGNARTQRSKLFRYAGLTLGVATSATFASKMYAARSVQPRLIITRAEIDLCPLRSDKDEVRAFAKLHPDTDVQCFDKESLDKALAFHTSNCFTYAKSDYESKKFEDPIDMNKLMDQATCEDLDKSLTETHKWKKKISAKECADGTTHVRSYLSKPWTPEAPETRQDYHFVVNPDSKEATHKPGSFGVDVLNRSFVEDDNGLAKKDIVIFNGERAQPIDIPKYDACDDYCVEREEAPKGRIIS